MKSVKQQHSKTTLVSNQMEDDTNQGQYQDEINDPSTEKLQFLFSLLERASSEREELLTVIEEQRETIEKLSKKTSLEEKAFRKVLTEEREKFDKRILRNKSMIQRRDQLLCDWAEIGTIILMSHPHDPLAHVLEKTCMLLPEAKRLSSRRYLDVLHHPTAYHPTPGGGTILEEEEEDEDRSNPTSSSRYKDHSTSNESPPPSLKMSLSNNSLLPNETDLQQSSVEPLPKHHILIDDDHSLPSISLTQSLASSIQTQHINSPNSSTTNSNKIKKPSAPTLQNILFGEGTLEDNYQPSSLYELSGSIESLNSSTKEKKKKKEHSTYSSDNDHHEVENLLGISLTSVHSLTSDGMGVTVVGTAPDLSVGTKKEKEIKKKKNQPSSQSSSSSQTSKKYWWDHLVDADVNTNQDPDIPSGASVINLGNELEDDYTSLGEDNPDDDQAYLDEVNEDENERRYEEEQEQEQEEVQENEESLRRGRRR